MGIGSRTTPHEDNSPPDKNKAQPLPTRTTIPRTIPHQDNSYYHGIKPLIRTKTCTVGNCPPGELSGYASDHGVRGLQPPPPPKKKRRIIIIKKSNRILLKFDDILFCLLALLFVSQIVRIRSLDSPPKSFWLVRPCIMIQLSVQREYTRKKNMQYPTRKGNATWISLSVFTYLPNTFSMARQIECGP